MMAAHSSPRTTKLYDRTSDAVSLDEVERVVFQSHIPTARLACRLPGSIRASSSPISRVRRAGSTRASIAPAAKPRIWSRRTSCTSLQIGPPAPSATANQFRLLIHTAAYWLLHTLRGLAPKTSFWRDDQFDTIRLALILRQLPLPGQGLDQGAPGGGQGGMAPG
jgi:hypothetical protein